MRLERVRRAAVDEDLSYQTAAKTQREWIEANALIRSPRRSMYVLEEDFEHHGETLTRRGIIAALKLQEYTEGVIFPHERTRSEWVEDRVRLMQVARSAYSPLLAVADSGTAPALGALFLRTTQRPPYFSATVPGMAPLRLWRIDDADVLADVSAVFADSRIIIADGHHRYEAALKYRGLCHEDHERERIGDECSCRYRMTLLVSSEEPGLITRGFHRTVSGLPLESLDALMKTIVGVGDVSDWTPPKRLDALDPLEIALLFSNALEREDGDTPIFGMVKRGEGDADLRFWLVRTRPRAGTVATDIVNNSDYVALHRDVLEPASLGENNPDLGFEHNLPHLLRSLMDGDIQMAFIMRPLPLSTFTEIASQGVRLPPKVTNFYPKPPAGCVIQPLEGRL